MSARNVGAQERVFEIVRMLVDVHAQGASNKEIAERLRITQATVCRDIAVLERYGWVARGESGRWRLSPEFGALSAQIIRSYQQAKLALVRAEAEYTAAMH